MILTNSTFVNRFLCNYNWHGKDPDSTAKKQAKPIQTNFKNFSTLNELLHYTPFNLKSQFFSFNFIISADNTCQINTATTLLLQPLDLVTKLQIGYPSYSISIVTLVPYQITWKDHNKTAFKNNRQKLKKKQIIIIINIKRMKCSARNP